MNHFNAIYTVWMNRYSSAAPIFIITVSNSGRLSSSTIFFIAKQMKNERRRMHCNYSFFTIAYFALILFLDCAVFC